MEMDPSIKAAHMEELRFWKRQQWAVTTAAIALIAGAFHVAQTVMPPPVLWEKWVASILVGAIAVGGGWLIGGLQESLGQTRLALDSTDPDPKRGRRVVSGLWAALLISAAAVIYSLWRA